LDSTADWAATAGAKPGFAGIAAGGGALGRIEWAWTTGGRLHLRAAANAEASVFALISRLPVREWL